MSETYRVLPGDTLSGIARKLGVTLAALEAANPQIHDPNRIYVGQLIWLPGKKHDAGDVPTPPPGSNLDVWARGVLVSVWPTARPGEIPTTAELQAVQAVGRLEGFYGMATKPAGWAGSNNWGAIQCHNRPPCGADCFEAGDNDEHGNAYRACFRRYASPEAGALDLLHELMRRAGVPAALKTGNATAIAGAMRATGYFALAADAYAARIAGAAGAIASSLKEPLLVRKMVGAGDLIAGGLVLWGAWELYRALRG